MKLFIYFIVGRKKFQEFLQTQYSDENLKFWMAADAYQTKTAEERKDTARQVYEDFISTISPCEVFQVLLNLFSKIRKLHEN